MKIAFAGSFAGRLADAVKAPLSQPCEMVCDDETAILPLSPRTRGLLDARRLAAMKRSAFLINVGRAEIVDEAALYRALSNGGLAGAALDVWYRYPTSAGPTPPATLPFHTLANVIMTPHVSGWTEGMLEGRAKVIAENIERTARGELPINAVDPAR